MLSEEGQWPQQTSVNGSSVFSPGDLSRIGATCKPPSFTNQPFTHQRLEFLLRVIHFQHEAHALWKIKCSTPARRLCALKRLLPFVSGAIVHSTKHRHKHRQILRKGNKLLLLRTRQHSSVRLMKSGTDFVRNLTLAEPNMTMHQRMSCKVRLGKWNLESLTILPTNTQKKRLGKRKASVILMASSPHSSQAIQLPARAGQNRKPVSFMTSDATETCTWSALQRMSTMPCEMDKTFLYIIDL